MKQLLLLLMVVSCIFAKRNDSNLSTGWENLDTILSFNADSLKYTGVYNLSGYQNLRVDVYTRDTSTAGYSADSVNFAWGLQTGHETINSSGNRDTVWTPLKYICDTLSRYDSLYSDSSASYVEVGLDGTYNNIKRLKDTLSVTGYIVQTTNFSPMWDVLMRGWVQGLAGNDVGSMLDVKMLFLQRVREPK
jgi:hypothetical protein